MQSFRKLTKNLAFKVILGVVALSFVFFGISSFILGGSTNWVAKIGSKTISYSTLQKAMKDNREMILSSYGNNEQALAYLESEQFVSDSLGRIINQQMVKNLSQEFDISANKKTVLENIAKDKNFNGADGKFSQDKFNEFLKKNGINEEIYVSEIINQISMTMIIQTMEIAAPVSSQKIIDVIEFNEEKREVDLVSLVQKNLKKLENVSDSEVEKYYKDNKKQFTIPDLRKISYAKINAKDLLSASTEVSDEEVVKEYEKNKSLYRTPQSRDFFHIVFDKEQEAKDFVSKLEASKKDEIKTAFLKLAKELKKKELKDIELVKTQQNQLTSETKEKAFSLKLNELSKPIKSALGYHIFLVNSITQESEKTLAQAKDDIKKKLIEQKQIGATDKKITDLDSDLLAGKALTEILNKNKITAQIDQVNIEKSGKTDQGQEPFGEDSEVIAKSIFDLKKDQNSKLISAKNSQVYYAIHLSEIIPSNVVEFEKVKDEISKKLQIDKNQEALKNFANEVAKEISDNPSELDKIVAKHKLKIEKNRLMPRAFVVNYQGRQFPYKSPLLDKIFALELSQNTEAVAEGEGYSIAILKKIQKPKITKEVVEEVAKTSQQMFRSDIMQQFNNYLLKKYPVAVNEKIFKKNE